MDAIGLLSTINSLSNKKVSVRLSGRVCCDSRLVAAGDVFVAVRGVHSDGHDFIGQAVKAGAAVVVTERDVAVDGLEDYVLVADSALALGRLAQSAAGEPSRGMTTLAATGTNGKTTVAYLVRAMLRAGGIGCGMVGTVEYDVGAGAVVRASNTTPDAVRLAEMMRQMRSNGLTAVVMECSSHGLQQGRVGGIEFDAAAFTNLSGDHLDYHGSMEKYLAAKSILFSGLTGEAVAILNGQDPASEAIAELSRVKVWRFGVNGEFEISGRLEAMGVDGCQFELELLGEKVKVRTGLVGLHNVSNCLAAAGLARAAGVSVKTIAAGIESFSGVPGRLERVDCGQDFTVLVDYAHTDDALRHVLGALRGLLRGGRLILVFGCGGERDRTKRPRMAAAAEELVDVIVLTHDNPRSEEPGRILADIRAGFSGSGRRKVMELPDRREAIGYAIKNAQAGDVVLIAGKGHEDYQIIGSEYRHFDDREAAREELKKRC